MMLKSLVRSRRDRSTRVDWLRTTLAISLVALLVPLQMGCESTGPRTQAMQSREWIVAKSARFEIFSSISVEETKELALELERFHALIYSITTAPSVEPAIPTRIYVLDRKSDLRRFTHSRDTAGFMAPGLRANLIVLADCDRTLGASQIILHEYTHFVVRNGRQEQYPLWYDEGFAELLSTSRSHENVMVIGEVPRARVNSFRYGKWLPIERIISAGSLESLGNHAHMLYAEGWALVHYLAFDRPGQHSLARELEEYLPLVRQGMEEADAFEIAFGETPAMASKNIIRLLSKGMRVLSAPIASLEYDDREPSVRTLPPAESSLRLAQLSLSTGKSRSGRRALSRCPPARRQHDSCSG